MAVIKQGRPLSIYKLVQTRLGNLTCRHNQSTYTALTQLPKQNDGISRGKQANELRRSSGLERLPTSSLLRNLFLGVFITTPGLFRPGFAVLRKIANSESSILNPDRNPLLRALIKPLIYDQFCAGRDRVEICQTKSMIRSMGYSGVILGYGKEIQVTPSNSLQLQHSRNVKNDVEIEEWKEGNLNTLDMIGDGDWLAIKCTGAGSNVTGALMRNEDPPSQFDDAMSEICKRAKSKNCRILIDAEQQVVQTAIDKLTIDLMQRYNKNNEERALVYNTLQAYLKSSRDKLKNQLALAREGDWTLGIKLVRGAYINNCKREAIHDTKQETDDSYNGIVTDLVGGTNLGFAQGEFPKVQLFLAGHNPESIASAMNLIQSRAKDDRINVLPDFGQLQGMGDNLGCRILQQIEELKQNSDLGSNEVVVPRIYKYLTWGSIQECMQYLIRRVVENSGGTDRMRDGLPSYLQEVKRRALGR